MNNTLHSARRGGRWASLALLPALACTSGPSVETDAGPASDAGSVAKHQASPRPTQPEVSCLEDAKVRADNPNHMLVTLHGVQRRVQSATTHAALWARERAGDTLRLQWMANYDDTNLVGKGYENEVMVTLDVATSALPEGQEQVLPIDLNVVGAFSDPRASPFWPNELSETPGKTHTATVLHVVVWPIGDVEEFSYRARGNLRITRAAGRAVGSLELVVDDAQPVDQLTWAPLSSVACFDAPISDTSDVAACEACALERVDVSGTKDCGEQGTARVHTVTECVEAQLAHNEPFHVVVAVPGIDSQIRLLWVRKADGVMRVYDYDSTVCGGGGCSEPGCGPRVTWATCEHPTLIAAAALATTIDELIRCDTLSGGATLCEPDVLLR